MCVRARACVRACVCAYVCACVCVRVCALCIKTGHGDYGALFKIVYDNGEDEEMDLSEVCMCDYLMCEYTCVCACVIMRVHR